MAVVQSNRIEFQIKSKILLVGLFCRVDFWLILGIHQCYIRAIKNIIEKFHASNLMK